MQRAILIVGMAFLITGFQNCQEAKVSSSESSLSEKSGQLIAVTADDPEDASGSVVQEDEEYVGNDDTDPTPGPGMSGGAPTPPGQCKKNCNNGNGNGQPNKSDGYYVCILEGPGKSVKLGLSDTGLGGQNPVPGVVCVSRKGCLEIAAQVFEVKGPEFRGYCKEPGGNPHVGRLTDAELQLKVNELKNK